MRFVDRSRKVAGIVAPAPRLTLFALFMIACALSALVAVPLWLLEWAF